MTLSSSESSEESSAAPSSSSEGTSLSPITPTGLYDGYYDSLVSWTDGEDLMSQLHEIISGGDYNPIPYTGSKATTVYWNSNATADQDLYDHEFVDVVYKADPALKTRTDVDWQREHAWCASLMTGSTTTKATKTLGRATDFHNLFASSANGNTSRGNKNYGIADTSDPGYTDLTTDGGEDGYSYDPKTFEPADKDKGRLARAIFYMATMYNEEEYDPNNDVTMGPLTIVEERVDYVPGDGCAFAIGHLSELLQWSSIPVDLLEYQHNESVYSFVPASSDHAQGNRNPYVDFPGLVDYVYGAKKDQPGTLASLVSSYQSLGIGEEGIHHYAIKEAKRQYDTGVAFNKEDIKVVAVANDLSETAYTDFTVSGVQDGQALTENPTKITVKTPTNDITYSVTVATDPIDSATWKHRVTGKAKGQDFNGIETQAGVAHELDFDGVTWNVTWEKGAVGSNNSNLGAAFGTATAPVGTLTFETKADFAVDGKSFIDAIYLSGASASGTQTDVTFYVGDTQITKESLGYVDKATALVVGGALSAPAKGKIRIELSGMSKAVNVKYLAVHAHE